MTFTLFYEIDQFRLPLPSEFAAVADLTEEHLSLFYVSGFGDDDLVTFISSSTKLEDTTFNFGEPVGITYISTLVFAQMSFLPSEAEVEIIVESAFNGASLNDYLQNVQGLPISNLFSTTRSVTFEPGDSRRLGAICSAIR